METVSTIIALVLAVGLYMLYRRLFGVVYFGFGAMFRDFGICFIICIGLVNWAGRFITGALTGIGGFLLGLLKIALVIFGIFVALGVVGLVLKKLGVLKDEPEDGAESGQEEAPAEPDQVEGQAEGQAEGPDQEEGQDQGPDTEG